MFIEAKNIAKRYHTGEVATQVLCGVNLDMEQGQIGVILGPSGSGKSTLMNILGGVDRPDEGIVRVDGVEITNLQDEPLGEYRRQKVGFVFQFYNLVPNLTVAENIEVCQNISKSPLLLSDVVEAVGLKGKEGRFPRELSGGEQQRVSIARAIIKRPQLLLCDEPTGALDSATAREVLALLVKVNREVGATLLMITHNTAIAGLANRVFKLRDGQVIETYDNKELLPAERIEW